MLFVSYMCMFYPKIAARAVVCLYVALKFLAAWQLDHLVAPTFWEYVGLRSWEVLPWVFLPATWFYVICFTAFFAFDPLWFIALWWWKE